MSDESRSSPPDQPAKPAGAEAGEDQSREQKMAAIRARADALRAARAAQGAGSGSVAAAPTPAAVAPSAPAAAEDAPKSGEGSGEESSREDKMAAIRARAEALRAARAAGAAPPGAGPAAPAGAPARTAPAKAAAPSGIEVPVSSLNPGGRPGTPPQAPAIEAYGTINQSVEIRGEAGENENLKKLLGGLGAYQNPLRTNAWQVDYQYYAEARKRLEAAGYKITEKDFLDRPIKNWSPTSRGWTRVEP